MRLRLHPDLVIAWRGPDVVQIGLDEDGLLLAPVDAGFRPLLQALRDGRLTARGLHRLARRAGITPGAVHDLLTELRRVGALLDPAPHLPAGHDLAALDAAARAAALDYPGSGGWPVLDRRRAATVLLAGVTAVTSDLARALLAAGVGRVLILDDRKVQREDLGHNGFDLHHVGHSRSRSVIEAVPGVAVGWPAADTDLVIIAADGHLPAEDADDYLRLDRAHLAVLLRERDAVVGPLVLPGRTCCLRCLEVYRVEKDPHWGMVAAQACQHRFRGRDRLLLARVTSVAVAEALMALDALTLPLTAGRTVEVSTRSPVPVVRAWPTHPRCGCTGLDP
ncbi:MAG: hypothetical protein ACK5MT_21445 [Actinomycetales bacterium]